MAADGQPLLKRRQMRVGTLAVQHLVTDDDEAEADGLAACLVASYGLGLG